MDRRNFLHGGSAAALGLAAGTALRAQPVARRAADTLDFLDPELRPVAQQMVAQGNLSLSREGLAAIRRQQGSAAEPPLGDIPVSQRKIPGSGGMPAVTVFVVNSGGSGRPGILHTHGGGHVLGSAKSELRYLQGVARELDCVLVTVEYRLAPETRFTGSVEDNYTALRWMYRSAAELGLDGARIALLGESAGGTHAALLAIAARDRGEVPVAYQCLVYPMLDDRTGAGTRLPPWMGAVLWTPESNRFGWHAFTGADPGSSAVPAAAVPARVANLRGLPPAWIGVGGADLFVEEDIAYAERLNRAGVPVELLVVPRAFHAFDRVVPSASVSRRFTKAKMDALRRAFGQPAAT